MTTVTEADIKELKDLILKQSEQLNKQSEQLNRQSEQLNIIDKKLGIVEARMEDWKITVQKFPELTEKIGELKYWKQVAVVIGSAAIGGLFTWFIRGGRS